MKASKPTTIAIIAASGLLALNPAIRAQDANKQANPADASPANAVAATESTNNVPTYEEVKGWITTYKAAHPGHSGKDWDINMKNQRRSHRIRLPNNCCRSVARNNGP